MNAIQRTTLWIVAILISLMCLVPPWVFRIEVPERGAGYTRAHHSGGYRPIMLPPKVPDEDWVFYGKELWSTHIDKTRLALQITPVLLIGGVVLLTARKIAISPVEE